MIFFNLFKLQIILYWRIRHWRVMENPVPFPVAGPNKGAMYQWVFQIGPVEIRRWGIESLIGRKHMRAKKVSVYKPKGRKKG